MDFGTLSECLVRAVTHPHVFVAYSQWHGWFCRGATPAKQFRTQLFTSHEIIHIRRGKGTYIIGDRIAQFRENDIFILGADLPHLFRYESNGADVLSDAHVIHFLPDFFSDGFMRIPEMKMLNDLLLKSGRGIQVTGDVYRPIGALVEELIDAQGVHRVVLLFSVLAKLCDQNMDDSIASLGFSHSYDARDSVRLNNIYQHVLSHFDREITLEEISGVANLSVNSFCRYFKTKTTKTFSNFLLEVRVGHACKLLLNTDLNISQICFECGFNNLSNFNRYFKKFAGQTPTQYLKNSAT